MKPLALYTFLAILLYSCNTAGDSVPDQNYTLRDESAAEHTLNSIETADKLSTANDSILLSFAKSQLQPGKHFTKVKYPYRPQKDTLWCSQLDSVLIYHYSLDSMLAYYEMFAPWSQNLRKDWANDSVRNAVSQFLTSLKKVQSCQGIVYDFGDRYLESFLFDSDTAAQNAQYHFESSEHFIFPKTLSYAVAVRNRLYVFHARYMGPSWNSKQDFQLFKEFVVGSTEEILN